MGAPLSGGEAPQQAAGERDTTTPPSDPGRLKDSRRFTMAFAGLAQLHLGNWEQGVAWFRRAIEANRNHPLTYFWLAAALAQLGRLEEACLAVKGGLALNSTFAISRARSAWTSIINNPTHLAQREPIFEGMRKAGVPE